MKTTSPHLQRLCNVHTPAYRVVILFAMLFFSATSIGAGGGSRAVEMPTSKAGSYEVMGCHTPRSHDIDAGEHRFVSVSVTAKRADLLVRLIDSEGRVLREAKGSRSGDLMISWIASEPSEYQLEIGCTGESDIAWAYHLRLVSGRKVSHVHKRLVQAELAKEVAEDLERQSRKKSIDAALLKYRRAADLYRGANRSDLRAEILITLARLYSRRGEYFRAASHYRKAIRLSTDKLPGTRARALAGLVEILIIRGRTQEAANYAQESVELATSLNDCCTKAITLRALGTAQYYLSDHDDALKSIQESLKLTRNSSDNVGEAQALNVLANIYNDLGRYQNALETEETALKIWKRVKDRRETAYTLLVESFIYSYMGKKTAALQLANEALYLFEDSGDPNGQAAAYNAVAFFYEDLDTRLALDYLKKSYTLFSAIGHELGAALTLGDLARCYFAAGQKRTALKYYKRYIEVSKALGDPKIQSVALRETGSAYQKLGDWKAAARYSMRAEALSRTATDIPGQAIAMAQIGDALRMSGVSSAAENSYRTALSIAKKCDQPTLEASILYRLARLELSRGRPEYALAMIGPALEITERVRESVADEQLRALYSGTTHDMYQLRVDVLMELSFGTEGSDLSRSAFENSEKSRARSLSETLRSKQQGTAMKVDPHLLARIAQVKRDLDVLMNRRIFSENTRHEEETDSRIRQLWGELQQLRNEIYDRAATYADVSNLVPYTAVEIQEMLLDPDSVLLEYFVGEARTYLWVLERNSFSSFVLPGGQSLAKAGLRLRRTLTARQPLAGETAAQYARRVRAAEARYASAAAHLGDMVLSPVADRIRNKRLLIVADGPLLFIPFAALRLTSDAGKLPLGATHDIVNLPSATAVMEVRHAQRKSQKRVPSTIAIFADPVFEAADDRIKIRLANDKNLRRTRETPVWYPSRSPASGRGGLSRLRASREEGEAIEKLFAPQAVTKAFDFDAAKRVLKTSRIGNADILHFATHGFINLDAPQLSGLVLSTIDAQGRAQLGFVGMDDIQELQLSARLVVLSACDSALGRNVRGDGVLGLPRAFMAAGAKNVLSTLWKVDDTATSEFIKQFYRSLVVEGLTESNAIRSAQIHMMNSDKWRSPFYWSGFVLYGSTW
jgi:CHAT domain-containing protein/tetratricopeptide (TPR) repeat protein